MRYAVIATGGKQYKVSVGETLLVDKLPQSTGDVVLDRVLLVRWDDAITLGTPTVNGASVTAKLLGDEKGEKLRISKFKSKVRYRRSVGFRAQLSRLQIVSINSAQKKSDEKKLETKVSKVEKAPKKTSVSKKTKE